MIRHNLLDTKLPPTNHDDDKPYASDTITTQQYSGTTVTISVIPALEARINNATGCIEEHKESQM